MRRWKLSPMDLASITRGEAYSRAKDEMMVHTDIAEAPWYMVDSDDKRRARLNMIAHLLDPRSGAVRRVRYDGDRAGGVVQHGVGDPPELEPEVPLPARSADDQKVGTVRGTHQHPAGGAFDGAPVHLDVRRDVLQGRFQLLRGPLLVQAGGVTDEQRMVGGLMRGAPPDPNGLQGHAASPGLLGGEAHRRRLLRVLADAHDDAPVDGRRRLVVVAAAQHDHRKSAWAATARLTEPSSISAMPLRPRVPTTSAEACMASRTRAYSGSSSTTSALTSKSGCRSRAR